MKYLFSLLLFTTVVCVELPAQREIPGQIAVESVFGVSNDIDLNLCCFAAYGWHVAEELKVYQNISGTVSSENISVYLLQEGISPMQEEQYFELNDGRYLVVSSEDNFNKVLDRFLINHKSK